MGILWASRGHLMGMSMSWARGYLVYHVLHRDTYSRRDYPNYSLSAVLLLLLILLRQEGEHDFFNEILIQMDRLK